MNEKADRVRQITYFWEYKQDCSNDIDSIKTSRLCEGMTDIDFNLSRSKQLPRLEKSFSYEESRLKKMKLKHTNTVLRPKSRDPIAMSDLLYHENEYWSLIGYIDPLGQFKLNLHSAGIELWSSGLTENIGFFEKLIFDSSLKDWHINIQNAFEIHKTIFHWLMSYNKTRRGRLLRSKILNWSYFDNIQSYLVLDEDLTWYNNPILM